MKAVSTRPRMFGRLVTPPTPGWSIQTTGEERVFANLAQEWDALHARCQGATPFQSHAWLASWWQAYGAPGRLRLFLVRKAGRLVAAAAMMVERRVPYPVLSLVGSGVSDFTDVLLDGEYHQEASRAMIRALLANRGWRLLDLREVRANASAWQLYQRWPGARFRLPDSQCLQLTDTCMDSLLDRLPGRTASKLKSKIRKIDKSGIAVRVTGRDEADEAVGTLLSLHGEQWRGRGIDPEHLRTRFREHLARAVPQMIAGGHVALMQYSVEGKVVACDLLLVGHDFVGGYLYGIKPELTRAVHVNAMLVRNGLSVMRERGIGTFSLLRGVEDHKMHWRPDLVTNERLLLVRPRSVTGAAHASTVRHARTLALVAKERFPERVQPWMRAARKQSERVRERLRGGR